MRGGSVVQKLVFVAEIFVALPTWPGTFVSASSTSFGRVSDSLECVVRGYNCEETRIGVLFRPKDDRFTSGSEAVVPVLQWIGRGVQDNKIDVSSCSASTIERVQCASFQMPRWKAGFPCC